MSLINSSIIKWQKCNRKGSKIICYNNSAGGNIWGNFKPRGYKNGRRP